MHLTRGESQRGPTSGVVVILIGDNRVQAVVAAGELDYHQDPVACVARRCRRPG